MVNGAKSAETSACSAKYHERGSLVLPADTAVRAVGAFADRMQAPRLNQSLDEKMVSRTPK